MTTNFYQIIIHGSDARFETHISVNRISGEMEWEQGYPPFDNFTKGNVQHSGKCERVATGVRL